MGGGALPWKATSHADDGQWLRHGRGTIAHLYSGVVDCHVEESVQASYESEWPAFAEL